MSTVTCDRIAIPRLQSSTSSYDIQRLAIRLIVVIPSPCCPSFPNHVQCSSTWNRPSCRCRENAVHKTQHTNWEKNTRSRCVFRITSDPNRLLQAVRWGKAMRQGLPSILSVEVLVMWAIPELIASENNPEWMWIVDSLSSAWSVSHVWDD